MRTSFPTRVWLRQRHDPSTKTYARHMLIALPTHDAWAAVAASSPERHPLTVVMESHPRLTRKQIHSEPGTALRATASGRRTDASRSSLAQWTICMRGDLPMRLRCSRQRLAPYRGLPYPMDIDFSPFLLSIDRSPPAATKNDRRFIRARIEHPPAPSNAVPETPE